MGAALAQSQEPAEDALIMFLGDSMICKDSVVCSEECSKWRMLRLLGVADNLKEDVDVWEEMVSPRTIVLQDQEICTLVTQGRQLLNGRRVWHPACSDCAVDAFQVGRLDRRFINGGDGIRAFI